MAFTIVLHSITETCHSLDLLRIRLLNKPTLSNVSPPLQKARNQITEPPPLLDGLIDTFKFDYEYEFGYEYDFLTFELVMLTTRSSEIRQEDGHGI